MTLSVGKVSLHVDGDRCSICRRCLAQKVCKVRAIVRLDPDEPPFIDVHRCHGCMLCILECPFEAIITV
jgi:MinD superfamily P-loop ATPase